MDHHNPELESRRSGSFGRLSAASSSRRRSLSTSFSLPRHADDGIESESVSEAGDIGDRALHSTRVSASGRSHFSLENFAESGAVVPVQDDTGASFPVAPDLENISPLSVDAMVQNGEKKIVSSFFLPRKLFFSRLMVTRGDCQVAFDVCMQDEKEVPWLLGYITCLLSLAVFGILGVIC